MYHTRYSYPFYIKFVRRVGQLRADKVVQNVGKARSTSKDIDYSKVVIHVKLEKEKKWHSTSS